jgi:DNA modification methylase
MIEINPKYVEWIKKRFEKTCSIKVEPIVSTKKIHQYFNLNLLEAINDKL